MTPLGKFVTDIFWRRLFPGNATRFKSPRLLIVLIVFATTSACAINSASSIPTTLKPIREYSPTVKGATYIGGTNQLAPPQVQIACVSQTCTKQTVAGSYPGICKGLIVPNNVEISSLLSSYVQRTDRSLLSPAYLATLAKLPLESTNLVQIQSELETLCQATPIVYTYYPSAYSCPMSIGDGFKLVFKFNSLTSVTFLINTDGCSSISMEFGKNVYNGPGLFGSQFDPLAALIGVDPTSLNRNGVN